MARSRKKTSRDRVVEAALQFAPAPVRKIASNPIGFRVVMIAMAGLMATGILSLDWNNGQPQFQLNRERAQEVRQGLVDDLKKQVGQWEQGPGGYPSEPLPVASYGQPYGQPVPGTAQFPPQVPATGTGYPQTGMDPWRQATPQVPGYYYPPQQNPYAPAQPPPQGYGPNYQNPYPPNYRR